MDEKNVIHVALCTDDNVHDPLFVAIGSVLRCCKTAPVAIHVATTGLSPEFVERLRALCNRLGAAQFDVVTVDANAFADFQSTEWIPREAHIRFLLASLFPHLDRMLYLDCDVLVCQDLYPLWTLSMDGCACAGSDKEWAHDPRYCTQIGLATSDVYVNSGVLLMNLRRFRDEGWGTRLMTFARTANIKFPCVDQDVLNIVLRGQIRPIPSRWNFTSYEFRTRRREVTGAAIIHFTGPVKPWPTKAKRCWDWRGWLWRENYLECDLIATGRRVRLGDRICRLFLAGMKRISLRFL